ncbi:MAG: fumarylacetoacetate hydrolase family protein [Alphaproteobacteria bacterium]|nr:fumarylacetoacetate hydrolase family protein [Alphaproteobacteria bacterium]
MSIRPPEDADRAALAGRVWRDDVEGPSVVVLREGRLVDVTGAFPTITDLLAADDPAAALRAAPGEDLGPLEARSTLLAPVDLQAVKACGVTFAASMLERVIEEQARGDPAAAEGVRNVLAKEIGADLAAIRPGSAEAARLKQALVERGLWSAYLEVGIGPDAEVFTKAQPMSAVGPGMEIGIRSDSVWNNPEPELVLVIAPSGRIVGGTLGNDVNLRDIEGRSALLLGQAKDNNASTALGPFIRLVDGDYGLDDMRNAEIALHVAGEDGFVMEGASSMAEISRDIEDLAAHTIGAEHDYPDGLVLFTGTMFAPIQDRDAPGQGFTHKEGDLVSISSLRLGTLANRVTTCENAPRWTFGARALMANLAGRGLLG